MSSYESNTNDVKGEFSPDVTSEALAKAKAEERVKAAKKALAEERVEAAKKALDEAKEECLILPEAEKKLKIAYSDMVEAKEKQRLAERGTDIGGGVRFFDTASTGKIHDAKAAYEKASKNYEERKKEFNEAQKNHDTCVRKKVKSDKELHKAVCDEYVADTSFFNALDGLAKISKSAKGILESIQKPYVGMSSKAERMFAAVKEIRKEGSVDFSTISSRNLLDRVLEVMTAQRNTTQRGEGTKKYNWKNPSWSIRGDPVELLLSNHTFVDKGCSCCGDSYHSEPEVRFPKGDPGLNRKKEGGKWLVGTDNKVRIVVFYTGGSGRGSTGTCLMIDGVVYDICDGQPPISKRDGSFHYSALSRSYWGQRYRPSNGGVRVSPLLSFDDRKTPFSEGGFGDAKSRMFGLFPHHEGEIEALEKERAAHYAEYDRISKKLEAKKRDRVLGETYVIPYGPERTKLVIRLQEMDKLERSPESFFNRFRKYEGIEVRYGDIDRLVRERIDALTKTPPTD